MLSLRSLTNNLSNLRLLSTSATVFTDSVIKSGDLSKNEIWERRRKFATPQIQRSEKQVSKFYYAPKWDLKATKTKDEPYSPMVRCMTTPDKWEYQNKVIWPINYIVPETGLPKPVEVFHCEESFRFSPKRTWYACQFVERMKVDDALLQLKFQNNKAALILTSVIEKAKERASKEFHVKEPGNMFIAEAFPIQSKIIKSMRRHAREKWCKRRHRYVNIFVRLEEGEPPGYKGAKPLPTGWQHMDSYYKYLRSREIKMLN